MHGSTPYSERNSTLDDFGRALTAHFAEVARRQDAVIQQVREAYTARVDALLQEIRAQAQAALPSVEDARRVVAHLADRGWFVLSEDPLKPCAELLQAGAPDEIDAYMVRYARRHLLEVKNGVLDRWPHRSHVLELAFVAHDRGEFALSILALLREADGIAHELFGGFLFARKPSARKTVADRMQHADLDLETGYLGLVLAPLVEGSSMTVHTTVRDQRQAHDASFGPLNRHGVLHGKDLNYPNEENSLRAITLLGYLQYADSCLEGAETIQEMTAGLLP
jgi:hypothetical protein